MKYLPTIMALCAFALSTNAQQGAPLGYRTTWECSCPGDVPPCPTPDGYVHESICSQGTSGAECREIHQWQVLNRQTGHCPVNSVTTPLFPIELALAGLDPPSGWVGFCWKYECACPWDHLPSAPPCTNGEGPYTFSGTCYPWEYGNLQHCYDRLEGLMWGEWTATGHCAWNVVSCDGFPLGR